jgi:hypothetical protein
METFLTALAVLAIGGLVSAAVKYPKGYMRIYIALAFVLSLIMTALAAFNVGIHYGATAATPYLNPSKIDEARAAIYSVRISELWIIVVGAFGLFLAFLSYIQEILGPAENDKK